MKKTFAKSNEDEYLLILRLLRIELGYKLQEKIAACNGTFPRAYLHDGFVAYDSYCGIRGRVNTHKKRLISNFAISERVKIWHQRSFSCARVRIVYDKLYRGERR